MADAEIGVILQRLEVRLTRSRWLVLDGGLVTMAWPSSPQVGEDQTQGVVEKVNGCWESLVVAFNGWL